MANWTAVDVPKEQESLAPPPVTPKADVVSAEMEKKRLRSTPSKKNVPKRESKINQARAVKFRRRRTTRLHRLFRHFLGRLSSLEHSERESAKVFPRNFPHGSFPLIAQVCNLRL